jgi:hypothetical protein
MSEKEIEFGDGSVVKLIVNDGTLCLTIQGRHMEEDKPKFTSATVTLDSEETIDLINWIGNELLKEKQNG